MGKIQRNHVDFPICDKDRHIQAILGLADNSHDQKDRKVSDAFKAIRTRSVTKNTPDPIINQ